MDGGIATPQDSHARGQSFAARVLLLSQRSTEATTVPEWQLPLLSIRSRYDHPRLTSNLVGSLCSSRGIRPFCSVSLSQIRRKASMFPHDGEDPPTSRRARAHGSRASHSQQTDASGRTHNSGRQAGTHQGGRVGQDSHARGQSFAARVLLLSQRSTEATTVPEWQLPLLSIRSRYDHPRLTSNLVGSLCSSRGIRPFCSVSLSQIRRKASMFPHDGEDPPTSRRARAHGSRANAGSLACRRRHSNPVRA